MVHPATLTSEILLASKRDVVDGGVLVSQGRETKAADRCNASSFDYRGFVLACYGLLALQIAPFVGELPPAAGHKPHVRYGIGSSDETYLACGQWTSILTCGCLLRLAAGKHVGGIPLCS